MSRASAPVAAVPSWALESCSLVGGAFFEDVNREAMSPVTGLKICAAWANSWSSFVWSALLVWRARSGGRVLWSWGLEGSVAALYSRKER